MNMMRDTLAMIHAGAADTVRREPHKLSTRELIENFNPVRHERKPIDGPVRHPEIPGCKYMPYLRAYRPLKPGET